MIMKVNIKNQGALEKCWIERDSVCKLQCQFIHAHNNDYESKQYQKSLHIGEINIWAECDSVSKLHRQLIHAHSYSKQIDASELHDDEGSMDGLTVIDWLTDW